MQVAVESVVIMKIGKMTCYNSPAGQLQQAPGSNSMTVCCGATRLPGADEDMEQFDPKR